MAEAKSILEVRAGIVERLIKAFQIERYVYLAATAASVLMLLVAGVMLIWQGQAGGGQAGGGQAGGGPGWLTVLPLLFGPTGVVVVCTQQLLRMWSRAMDLLLGPATGKGEG